MPHPFISGTIQRGGFPLDCVVYFQVVLHPGGDDFDAAITGMEVDSCHPDEGPLTDPERIALHNEFFDARWPAVCAAAEGWLVEQRRDAAQVRADMARDDIGETV